MAYVKLSDVTDYLIDKTPLKGEDLGDAVNAMCELATNDVRPVVLCRDCKWCHAGYCEKFDDIIPWGVVDRPWEEWFCADGKKREES